MTVSVKSWVVLSSLLTTTFSAGFSFGSSFATKTAQNVPCIIIHGQLSLPRKNAGNHQAYLFLWPNINMSWKGQNVAFRFNMFSMVFPPSRSPLGEFMTSKYNLVFILFVFILKVHFFLVFFFLCVWERYCFWMSITQQRGKDHKTNPRHQKASFHCYWMKLNIATQPMHGNARLHGFNFTHGGICL